MGSTAMVAPDAPGVYECAPCISAWHAGAPRVVEDFFLLVKLVLRPAQHTLEEERRINGAPIIGAGGALFHGFGGKSRGSS